MFRQRTRSATRTSLVIQSNPVTIAASSGLSDKEIEKMVNQAAEFAETDKKRKEVIEATNHAENVIHETERAMTEHKDKLDKEESDKLTEQIKELRTIMQLDPDSNSAEAIKEAYGNVQQASLKLFQKVYESKAQDAESAGKQEPVDAEFKDAEKK